MPKHFERLDAVRLEIFQALNTLRAVLDHIDSSKPPPELRVAITNNAVVAFVSVIEEGLRGLFAEYLAILEEEVPRYDLLRGEVQKANVKAAAQALRDLKGDARAMRDTAINLANCLSGESEFQLQRDQIVRNDGNFRTGQVTTIAKNVGLKEFWKHVCDCKELEDLTGETDVDRRCTAVERTWNSLYDERDVIVHWYSRASGWDRNKIENTLSLCELVLVRIPVCLSQDLGDYLARIGRQQEYS